MKELKREGHRKRVKDAYLNNPKMIESMSDHNMLELLLFYSIPRVDVKEVAYALMNRFGSLENVFNATPDELVTVDGIGENSAILISLVKHFHDRIKINQNSKTKKLTNFNVTAKYVSNLIGSSTVEKVIVISLDNDLNIIKTHFVADGTVNHAHVETADIIKRLLNDKASSVIIAHNHPKGSCEPSADDVNFTIKMLDMFRKISIRFIDHVIVNEHDCFCMSQECKYADYFDR